MTEAYRLSRAHPYLRERMVRVLSAWRAKAGPGETILAIETDRSLHQQQLYYAKGASKADGIRNFSFHQFNPALGCDCLIYRNGHVVNDVSDPAWIRYGELGEAEGLEWGGRWHGIVDGPHLQVPETECIRILQVVVGAKPDGDWGPRTDTAVVAALHGRATLRDDHHGWERMTPPCWAVLVGSG